MRSATSWRSNTCSRGLAHTSRRVCFQLAEKVPRGQNRKAVCQLKQMMIARDEHGSLGGGEPNQVVVIRVGRSAFCERRILDQKSGRAERGDEIGDIRLG